MVTEKQIQDITRVIVETVRPKKVYLIGSHAEGRATLESDVDFLIVAGDEKVPKYERTGSIQKKLFHYPDLAIDLTLFTEAEVEKKEFNELTFIGSSLKRGRLLYEC